MTFKDVSYLVLLLKTKGLTDSQVINILINLDSLYVALLNVQSARGGEDGNDINSTK